MYTSIFPSFDSDSGAQQYFIHFFFPLENMFFNNNPNYDIVFPTIAIATIYTHIIVGNSICITTFPTIANDYIYIYI